MQTSRGRRFANFPVVVYSFLSCVLCCSLFLTGSGDAEGCSVSLEEIGMHNSGTCERCRRVLKKGYKYCVFLLRDQSSSRVRCLSGRQEAARLRLTRPLSEAEENFRLTAYHTRTFVSKRFSRLDKDTIYLSHVGPPSMVTFNLPMTVLFMYLTRTKPLARI